MAENTVKFLFFITQTVWLIPMECSAVVTCLEYGMSGKRYQVVYWNDGERKSEWVFENELRDTK